MGMGLRGYGKMWHTTAEPGKTGELGNHRDHCHLELARGKFLFIATFEVSSFVYIPHWDTGLEGGKTTLKTLLCRDRNRLSNFVKTNSPLKSVLASTIHQKCSDQLS
ncbi:unnamed protein product [Natator depressus]